MSSNNINSSLTNNEFNSQKYGYGNSKSEPVLSRRDSLNANEEKFIIRQSLSSVINNPKVCKW